MSKTIYRFGLAGGRITRISMNDGIACVPERAAAIIALEEITNAEAA